VRLGLVINTPQFADGVAAYRGLAGFGNLDSDDQWSFCLAAGKINPRIRR